MKAAPYSPPFTTRLALVVRDYQLRHRGRVPDQLAHRATHVALGLPQQHGALDAAAAHWGGDEGRRRAWARGHAALLVLPLPSHRPQECEHPSHTQASPPGHQRKGGGVAKGADALAVQRHAGGQLASLQVVDAHGGVQGRGDQAHVCRVVETKRRLGSSCTQGGKQTASCTPKQLASPPTHAPTRDVLQPGHPVTVLCVHHL